MGTQPGQAPARQGVEALYPFLYAGDTDLDDVLAEVRRSTVAKAQEIVRLREQVLDQYGAQLAECAQAMADSFAAGGRLLAFGNGGSSTDAQDVSSMFLQGDGGRPLPALSLAADIAVVTALSNDIGFDVVFARQLAAMGRPGDIALGLSTSGNSGNLVSAFEEAARRGMVTVGIAGGQGGKMAEADTIEHLFVIPSASVHRIQEAQTTVYHVLWELTQRILAGEWERQSNR
ncbi:MAG: SIS domain-containing protein [Actinomycetota bacterium]|nr:SIS domain-containing protein [Actinomycetota bacterium]